MTTSQSAQYFAEIAAELDVIPADKLAYLQERLRNRLYDLVVSEFVKHNSANPEFTQAALARRIRSRPELVSRWLSSPGNWTLDTVSNLLAGIAGAELEIGISKLGDAAPRNFCRPEWLDEPDFTYRLSPDPYANITIDNAPTQSVEL